MHTLVWLRGGNLEPSRDISFVEADYGRQIVLIDATVKTPPHDQFSREWPNVVVMDDKTIKETDRRWNALGLGNLILSPSLKYKPLVRGNGAVREY
jgi:4-hydroxy-3-polyprenylbenzoate decarboxylase